MVLRPFEFSALLQDANNQRRKKAIEDDKMIEIDLNVWKEYTNKPIHEYLGSKIPSKRIVLKRTKKS